MTGQRRIELLQIHRDILNPGVDQDFRAAEEEAARICTELGCPHPHFALESLSGRKEVWWINAFESEADRSRIVAAYGANQPLTAALAAIGRRRERLIESESDTFVTYCPELSSNPHLMIGGARFVTVKRTTDRQSLGGSVFAAPDGELFALHPARTQSEAVAALGGGGGDVVVFAVRPYWGMPSPEWIAADPEFWSVNPRASAG